MGDTEKKKKKKPKPRVVDFTPEDEPRTMGPDGKQLSMSRKQIRTRARRTGQLNKAEFEALYKPLHEWDEEELARGRPRDKNGSFRGRAPNWVTRELHEEAMSRFKGIIEGKMRTETITALRLIHNILEDDEFDEKGRPVVSASTKLDGAKFLIEHAIGKPKQRQEVDISVRLQGLLAMATAGPINGGVEELASGPEGAYEEAFGDTSSKASDADVTDVESWEEDDDLGESE